MYGVVALGKLELRIIDKTENPKEAKREQKNEASRFKG